MNKNELFGVLILAAGIVMFEEIVDFSKKDVILISHHWGDHLPEEPRPEGTTKTSFTFTTEATSATTTTTTAP